MNEYDLTNDTVNFDLRLSFDSLFTDAAILAGIDTLHLLNGFGYGDLVSIHADFDVTSASISRGQSPVPLPSSGALMALTLGGAGLLVPRNCGGRQKGGACGGLNRNSPGIRDRRRFRFSG